MTMENLIPLRTLAEELGMDRSHLRRYVKRLGIEPGRTRTKDSRNQITLAITPSEANYVRNERHRAGFASRDTPITSDGSRGYFYVVQLEPEHLPERLKFGFSASVDNRLTEYRSSNPGAILLKTWPAKRSWEAAIIDCLSISVSCELIGGEVYHCSDITELLERADTFISLLPGPEGSAIE